MASLQVENGHSVENLEGEEEEVDVEVGVVKKTKQVTKKERAGKESEGRRDNTKRGRDETMTSTCSKAQKQNS